MSILFKAIIAVVALTLLVIAFQKLGISMTVGILLLIGALFFFIGVIYWWAVNNV